MGLFDWIAGQRSTIAVLRRLMTRKQWAKLCLDTPDWRHLFANAAAMLNVPEDKLLQQVARRSGFAYLPSVEPVDLSVLGREFTLSNLRRYGAIALVQAGKLEGFVCLDPTRLAGLRGYKTQQNVFISSWLSIAQALDESERNYLAQQAAEEQERAKRRELLAEGVLEFTLKEAEHFGAGEVRLEFKEENVRYSFVTPAGKEAWGTIDSRVREALLRLLRKASHDGGSRAKPNERGSCREIRIAPGTIEDYPAFRLTWQHKASLPREEHGLAPLPESFSREVSQVALTKEGSEVVQVSMSADRESFSHLPPTAGPKELVSRVLPFPGHADNPAAESPLGEKASFRPVVLIIDDNQTFIRVLERFLTRHGLQTVSSGSCEDAMQTLKSRQITPDLIICDIHMPGMNGFDFLKWLRTESHIAAAPFVMLSSDEDVETKLRVLNGGADAFVGKTEDPRILCAQVNQLIERRKAA